VADTTADLDSNIQSPCDGKVGSMEILDASRKGLLIALVELAKARKEAVKLMLSKIS